MAHRGSARSADVYREAAETRLAAAQKLAASDLPASSGDVLLLAGTACECLLRATSPEPGGDPSNHSLTHWFEQSTLFVPETEMGGALRYTIKTWRSSDRYLGTKDLRAEVRRRVGRLRKGERRGGDHLVDAARLALQTARTLLALAPDP